MNTARGGVFEGQHPDAMLFGAGLVEALIHSVRGRDGATHLSREPVVFLNELGAVLDLIRIREGDWFSARARPSGTARLRSSFGPWSRQLSNCGSIGDGSMVVWGEVVCLGFMACRMLPHRIAVASWGRAECPKESHVHLLRVRHCIPS